MAPALLPQGRSRPETRTRAMTATTKQTLRTTGRPSTIPPALHAFKRVQMLCSALAWSYVSMQNARREYNVADLARQRGGWLCFFSIGLVLAASIVQGARRVLRMLSGAHALFKT